MKWSNPLTPEQLEFIDPILHRMALPFSKCEADTLDLVQTAYLALFDGRRAWKNPLVCAYSAMLDYAKTQGKWRFTEDVELHGIEYEEQDRVEDEEFRSLDWLGFSLTPAEKQAAVWHWIDGISQVEIALTLGVPASTVSRWLVDLKNQIKNKFQRSFS